MKRSTALILTGLALPSLALGQSSVVDAPVVDVQPIVRVVSERVPYEVCREERVRVEERGVSGNVMPAVVGGLLGGAAGNILGRNSSKADVITGAGAVLGATVGYQRSQARNQGGSYYVTENVCNTEYELRERETRDGYRVSYRYGDDIYETRTARDPGATIPVRVRLEPLL